MCTVQLSQTEKRRLDKNTRLHFSISGGYRVFKFLLASLILVCLGAIGYRRFDNLSLMARQSYRVPLHKMRQRIRNIDTNRFLQPPRLRYGGRLDVLEMPELFKPIKNEDTRQNNKQKTIRLTP